MTAWWVLSVGLLELEIFGGAGDRRKKKVQWGIIF